MAEYNVEKYWDKVAENISERKDAELIAGDDDPYYKYKRKMFLKLFRAIPFQGKKVVEIGSGPGGNLMEVSKMNPLELWGVDVSENMLNLSARLLKGINVQLKKSDGIKLDFPECHFDIVFTSTVLQHNTNENDLNRLLLEISRISGSEIYLFERTEKTTQGHESNIGRPIEFYSKALGAQGFTLKESRFLNVRVSYFVCGAIRKIFNAKSRHEGQRISRMSYWMELAVLPFTRLLDKLVPQTRDLTMMHFERSVK